MLVHPYIFKTLTLVRVTWGLKSIPGDKGGKARVCIITQYTVGNVFRQNTVEVTLKRPTKEVQGTSVTHWTTLVCNQFMQMPRSNAIAGETDTAVTGIQKSKWEMIDTSMGGWGRSGTVDTGQAIAHYLHDGLWTTDFINPHLGGQENRCIGVSIQSPQVSDYKWLCKWGNFAEAFARPAAWLLDVLTLN